MYLQYDLPHQKIQKKMCGVALCTLNDKYLQYISACWNTHEEAVSKTDRNLNFPGAKQNIN